MLYMNVVVCSDDFSKELRVKFLFNESIKLPYSDIWCWKTQMSTIKFQMSFNCLHTIRIDVTYNPHIQCHSIQNHITGPFGPSDTNHNGILVWSSHQL